MYCCTLCYSACPFPPSLPFLLSAGPSRNKLGKQQAQEKTRSQTFQRKPGAAAAAVESSPEMASSLSLSESPLCVSASLPPLGRVSVCLCAEGFDTAIQALLLPWRCSPYKGSGVKEHRVGCSHTQTHTCTQKECLTGCRFLP